MEINSYNFPIFTDEEVLEESGFWDAVCSPFFLALLFSKAIAAAHHFEDGDVR